MPFVYHFRPKNLVGDTLYPLNTLRDHLPALYQEHVRKYEGREVMMERRIPYLECLWNDVLFFAPLHPQVIRDAYIEVGKFWPPAQWYEIDTTVHGFNAENTVIYEPDMQRQKNNFALPLEHVTPFEAENLTAIHVMPQASLDYFREAAQRNERIMPWRGITHVLYKGVISLEKARLFEL